jgi:hypothetical protein
MEALGYYLDELPVADPTEADVLGRASEAAARPSHRRNQTDVVAAGANDRIKRPVPRWSSRKEPSDGEAG